MLVRDIPFSDSKLGSNIAGPIFQHRVAAMFPVGSSSREIAEELKHQNFNLHTKNGETIASFTQWGIVRRDWWIKWTEDGEGRIRTINPFETWAAL
jgi:hypothetical protein